VGVTRHDRESKPHAAVQRTVPKVNMPSVDVWNLEENSKDGTLTCAREGQVVCASALLIRSSQALQAIVESVGSVLPTLLIYNGCRHLPRYGVLCVGADSISATD
jgi:hypothetical protein